MHLDSYRASSVDWARLCAIEMVRRCEGDLKAKVEMWRQWQDRELDHSQLTKEIIIYARIGGFRIVL